MECILAKHGVQFRVNGLIVSGAGGEARIHPKLLPAVKEVLPGQGTPN